MRAIDRMYFEKYAVDPENKDYIYDMSAAKWKDDPYESEIEPEGLYIDDWPEMD